MEEVSFTYDQDLENRILKIVAKIKNNRNRPCYQNIQSMLERGGKKISTDDLTVFIDSLIEKKLLVNNGSANRESFRIVDESIANNVDAEHNNDIEDIQNDILLKDTLDYLDDKFYNTLIKLIKDEVKSAVSSSQVNDTSKNLINDVKTFNNNELWSNDMVNNRNNNDLIDSLKSEISFLRKELTSVINLLHKNSIDRKPIDRVSISNKRDRNDNSINHNKIVSIDDSPKDNIYKMDSRALNVKIDDCTEGFTKVKSNNNKRSITIIGDSIVKDVKPFRMRNALPKNDKLFVKSFPGATVDCMASYIQPSLKFDPNLVILNAGTNDLRSNKSSDQIAGDIIDLALNIKSRVTEVAISGIVPRNDRLNMKGLDVNRILKQKLLTFDICYIDNENIDPIMHLNNSGLHLNPKGTSILANNYINYIKL